VVPPRVLVIPARPKEVLAVTHFHRDDHLRWPHCADPRLGSGAFYLHPLLNSTRHMRIVGISAFYHDSAAALLVDGQIVAAAQEERFTRKKHDARFPHHALAFCLDEGGITLGDLDYVAFYDKPFLKFERLLETYLTFAPRGFRSFRMAIPLWLKEKLFQKHLLRDELYAFDPKFDWESKLLFTEHHQSHAASAFFPSPFDEAVILTMDGVG